MWVPTLSMYPPPGETHMGNFIAWDNKTGKIVWSNKEQFSVWSGALATAGGVVFYGTLEALPEGGRCQDEGKNSTSSRLCPAPSATSRTYENNGRQYIAVLSGVGGWAGIGLRSGSDGSDCRSRCRRWLRSPDQLYRTRRRADVSFALPQ